MGAMPSGRLRRRAFIVAFNVIAAAAIIEGLFVVMLSAPSVTGATPRAFRRLMQQVYRHFDRGFIQFDPACARYDPELTYTLKPGDCTFENAEFSTAVYANRLGLRDDDASLDAPEVIVLGDSHAMGWGVEQNETLVRVLAAKSGLRVLNAAVSSYGTAREIRMLDRLDVSRLRTLIIQYSDNDLPENRSFRQHGGFLPIMSEAEYQGAVRHYGNQRRYYPGKYVYRLFMKLTRLEAPEPDRVQMDPVTPTEEAELFLNVLASGARTPLDGVNVIIFEINEQLTPPRPFIGALGEVSRRDGYPSFIRQLATLDVSTVLSSDDFYTLDDHLRAQGHANIGAALADLIR